MIKYKSLKKNIPAHIKVGNNEYEVLYTDSFKDISKDKIVLGKTYFDPAQIILRNGRSTKETVHTYFHEFIHAVSEEYKINLTETQVLELEKSFIDFKKFFSTLEGK